MKKMIINIALEKLKMSQEAEIIVLRRNSKRKIFRRREKLN
jgi:hypothetical protein